jgi:hypothetical protein
MNIQKWTCPSSGRKRDKPAACGDHAKRKVNQYAYNFEMRKLNC